MQNFYQAPTTAPQASGQIWQHKKSVVLDLMSKQAFLPKKCYKCNESGRERTKRFIWIPAWCYLFLLGGILLLLIPYAAMKLIAGRMGEASRNSLLGPVDRVLGFGFGAIKGSIIVVLAFSLLVLGYDTIWGVQGRPLWITQGRTYPVVNASADALVQMIEQRRAALRGEDDPEDSSLL